MRGWLRRLLGRDAAEGRVLRAGRRRARAERGSAYVEFAFLAPLLLMFASLLIELATFWDASVMANHAAWQVARIVKVKPNAKDATIFQVKTIDAEKGSLKEALVSGANAGIDLLNTFGDQRSLTAILLLSGSSMGYAGTPGNEMGDLLNLILLKPLDELAKGSKDGFDLSQAFSEAMSGASASGISGLSDGISELLMTAIVKPVIGAVGSALLTPVVGWAQTQLNNLGKKISGALDQKGGEFSAMKHYARNLQKAYQRVAYVSAGKGKKGGPIVKVYTANDGDIAFLAPSGTIRQPHVHTAKGTDPGLAGQLAYVRVRWPMASDWLFPLFWGGERADTGVWATGHALTLLEPTLTNDNLKSTDPKAYTPPAENAKGEYAGVSDTIRHDLRIELFLLRYRNVREDIHLSGDTYEHFFMQTAHHLQDWQSIAYDGKNYPDEYQKSWGAALDGAWYSSRGVLEVTLRGYLNGYHTRQWLYYGNGAQRYRYFGTQGGLPTIGGTAVDAATRTRWDRALEQSTEGGLLRSVSDGLGARLDAAGSAADAALKKLKELRAFLDNTAAELERRIGDEKAQGATIELDAATLQNLSGAGLTEGEAAVSPEALQSKWKETYANLKALRDQINGVAKDIGEACGAIAAVNGRLGQERKELEDAIAAVGEAKAKNRDRAIETLHTRLSAVDRTAEQLAAAAKTLSAKTDAALALEIRFAQQLQLKSSQSLDPAKLDWAELAKQNAVQDGVKDADLGKNAWDPYGDLDGKGETWKR